MSLILSIDLGKYYSIISGFDPSSGEIEFGTVKTTPAVLRPESPIAFGAWRKC